MDFKKVLFTETAGNRLHIKMKYMYSNSQCYHNRGQVLFSYTEIQLGARSFQKQFLYSIEQRQEKVIKK